MSPFLAYFCFNFYCFYQYFQESHWNTTWTRYCNWSYSPSSLCYNKPDTQNVITLNTSLCLMSSDAIVSQVLDELGLTMSDELSSKTTRRFFHTFSSIVFICPFLNDFVFLLQIFRALAEACQWLQERRRMPRAHRWTPMLIWRHDCKTYGENEHSSFHTVEEALDTSILPSLFRFSLWRCDWWITPVFQQMVHLIKVFLFEVFSFIVCIIYLIKMKKKTPTRIIVLLVGVENCFI